MSQFFSRKYLRYFGRPAAGATIDRDLPCPACGYNRRGLPENRRCPECGWNPLEYIPVGESPEYHDGKIERRPLIDALRFASGAGGKRWTTALTLAVFCILAALAARVIFFILEVLGRGDDAIKFYVFTGLVISIGWNIAAVMLLPAILGHFWRWVRPFRLFVLATQWLWIVAYVLWMVDLQRTGGPNVSQLTVIQFVLRTVAGLGVGVLVMVMRQVAEEAELEYAERRINLALWALPIITLIAAFILAAFPYTRTGFSGSPWAMMQLIYLGPPTFFLIAWCLTLIYLATGLWGMRRHVSWMKRLMLEARGREERIAETRRKIDEEVEPQTRPIIHREGEKIFKEGRRGDEPELKRELKRKLDRP